MKKLYTAAVLCILAVISVIFTASVQPDNSTAAYISYATPVSENVFTYLTADISEPPKEPSEPSEEVSEPSEEPSEPSEEISEPSEEPSEPSEEISEPSEEISDEPFEYISEPDIESSVSDEDVYNPPTGDGQEVYSVLMLMILSFVTGIILYKRKIWG